MKNHSWKLVIPALKRNKRHNVTYVRELSDSDAFTQRLLMVDEENWNTLRLLAISWTSLLGDSPFGLKTCRVINTFLRDFCYNPTETIDLYSDLGHQLQRKLLRDESGGVSIDADVVNLFRKTPVFLEVAEFQRSHCPVLLRWIFTFLFFGKKTKVVNGSLEPEALCSWLETEERIGNVVLPLWIENLKVIIDYILKGWDQHAFWPKHGSGCVAEKGIKGRVEKNRNFYLSRETAELLNLVNHEYDSLLDLLPWGPFTPADSVRREDVPARLIFVAKTYKSLRSICLMPVEKQWAQQGLRSMVEASIHKGPLSRHVYLKDQSKNRFGARYGSITSCVDTLDLSQASDSLLWSVISAVLPQKLVRCITLTRTRGVQLPGIDDTYIPVKAMPMGDAMCFPIQSVIYAGIIAMISIAMRFKLNWYNYEVFDRQNVELMWKHTFLDPYETNARKLEPFYVFGDDLICDSRSTPLIELALSELGFIVNNEKSFYGTSPFRESCGGEYFDGSDVTPLRFVKCSVSNSLCGDQLASIISLANRAWDRQYYNLRHNLVRFLLYYPLKYLSSRKLRKQVKGVKKNPIMFTDKLVDRPPLAIYSPLPTNDHLVHRGPELLDPGPQPLWRMETNVAYQRDEYLALVLKPSKVVRPSGPEHRFRLNDYYERVEWYASKIDYMSSYSVYFNTDGDPASTIIYGVANELYSIKDSNQVESHLAWLARW